MGFDQSRHNPLHRVLWNTSLFRHPHFEDKITDFGHPFLHHRYRGATTPSWQSCVEHGMGSHSESDTETPSYSKQGRPVEVHHFKICGARFRCAHYDKLNP